MTLHSSTRDDNVGVPVGGTVEHCSPSAHYWSPPDYSTTLLVFPYLFGVFARPIVGVLCVTDGGRSLRRRYRA